MFLNFLIVLLFAQCSFSNIISNNVLDDIPNNKENNHHKVHNIILYPDNHSWCEPKHIRQIVTHAHCKSKEMENHVCVGTCFSYSVPQTEPYNPGDELLDYCDSCQPQESHWTTVTLDCENDGAEFKVTKNIQLITNCSCTACRSVHKSKITNEAYEEPGQRITDLIDELIPETHKVSQSKIDLKNDVRYSQMSIGDLKSEIDLNADQELLLSGKLLVKDVASFAHEEQDKNSERGFYTVK